MHHWHVEPKHAGLPHFCHAIPGHKPESRLQIRSAWPAVKQTSALLAVFVILSYGHLGGELGGPIPERTPAVLHRVNEYLAGCDEED